jgi:hypothetical protein
LANQERLRQNSLVFAERRQQAQGVVREGPGVLQGLVVCGQCGRHMHTVYKSTPRYICRGVARTVKAPRECSSVRAPVVDSLVEAAFFAAIQPAHVDALGALLEAQRAERGQLEQVWRDQVKRAQYEAQLAQRQYDAVDPANRLVAAELERRWEASLQQLRETEEGLARFEQTALPAVVPPELVAVFGDISQRLPEVWPTLTNSQRKELLRSLIQRVIVRRPRRDQVAVRIVWLSGCYSDQTSLTPIHRERDVAGYDDLIARVQELWQEGYDDSHIAAELTTEGFHSARSEHVTTKSVMKIRLRHQWYAPFEQLRNAEKVGEAYTVRGLAKRLTVTESTVYRFIYRKVIPPERVTHEPLTGIYLICDDQELIEQLRVRIAAGKRQNGMLKVTGQA